jgi:hypothetical protein
VQRHGQAAYREEELIVTPAFIHREDEKGEENASVSSA